MGIFTKYLKLFKMMRVCNKFEQLQEMQGIEEFEPMIQQPFLPERLELGM